MHKLRILFAAAIMLTTLCGCSAGEPSVRVPDKVTLLIEEENRIISLSYTEYIAGCIFAAADPSFLPETLTAAGIACSGQALYCMENSAPGAFYGADLSDGGELCPEWISLDEARQEYGSEYDSCAEKVMNAAETAALTYPEYDGGPAFTPVCAVSTGITDDGGMPYLPSLTLECDSKSPLYFASCTVTARYARETLREMTGSVILPPDKGEWFTDEEYTPGGTLLKICFGGAEITGEQLRQALGLKSCAITVSPDGDMFTFTSLGCGRNTGMSVYTAERLARSGKTAREILDCFFPGTMLRTAQSSS